MPSPVRSELKFRALSFLASFLLFSGELMMARAVLPIFGSGASIWTTCLLFYQVVLLAGYLWANHAGKRLAARWTRALQLIAVSAPLALFLVQLLAKPELGSASPLFGWTLHTVSGLHWGARANLTAVLVVAIGLPFFALSTTSIFVQRWFVAASGHREVDSHFLYGASNFGALGALVLYPLGIDRVFGLRAQTAGWALLYLVFVVLQIVCMRAGSAEGAAPDRELEEEKPATPKLVFAYWLVLSAAGTALLTAVSNAVTLDASIPLSWVLPLGLYLGTFVVCFGKKPASFATIGILAALGFVLVGAVLPIAQIRPAWRQLGVVSLHCAIGWAGGLFCHWSLGRSRPAAPVLLGRFYLSIAVGGALGTALIAWFAPVALGKLAVDGIDYALVLLLAIAALALRLQDALALAVAIPKKSSFSWLAIGMIATASWMLASNARQKATTRIYSSRTFYGRYSVVEENGLRKFQFGSTVHGVESVDPKKETDPLAYFHHDSPIGKLFDAGLEGNRVAVVGLGIGTLAAYSKPGESWDFYEIDEEVTKIARTRFAYLDRASADHLEVYGGDARLALQEREPGSYSLIVLDAFTSDFLPTHLATREAVEIYLAKLDDEGLLAFNVSNRAFDFAPELERIARELDFAVVVAGHRQRRTPEETEQIAQGIFPSRWVVMTRDRSNLPALEAIGFEAPSQVPSGEAWTDDKLDSLRALSPLTSVASLLPAGHERGDVVYLAPMRPTWLMLLVLASAAGCGSESRTPESSQTVGVGNAPEPLPQASIEKTITPAIPSATPAGSSAASDWDARGTKLAARMWTVDKADFDPAAQTNAGLDCVLTELKTSPDGDRLVGHLVLTNLGQRPIYFFQRWNSWGAYQWRFALVDAKGHQFSAGNPQAVWTRNFPSGESIAPGAKLDMSIAIHFRPGYQHQDKVEDFVADIDAAPVFPLRVRGVFEASAPVPDVDKVPLAGTTTVVLAPALWIGRVISPWVEVG